MAPKKKREKKPTTSNSSVSVDLETATAASVAGLATPVANSDAVKRNGYQQDQELFLQAFKQPTQLYRILATRHDTNPIFVNRTLSYLKDRMSRNNKNRGLFKLDSMLDNHKQIPKSDPSNYLNIVFKGLFDKSGSSDQWWNAGDMVRVESLLYKITKSKRKESASDFQEIMSFTSNVVYKPHGNIVQFSAISIPVQSMRPFDDQHTTYKLIFRINATPKFSVTPTEQNSAKNYERASKRLKVNNKIYGCELIINETHVLSIYEGDYEVALQELSSTINKSFSSKKRSWETLPDPLSKKFETFNRFPSLKFRLTWDANVHGLQIDGATNIKTPAVGMESQFNHNNNYVKIGSAAKREKVQIIYNFLYSNNTRQKTESTQEAICPWCGLNCLRLQALLKHLKLCHAHFNFTYQTAGKDMCIDVTINDSYDSSYVESDLAVPSGCSRALKCGPVRRTVETNLLVCRPRRRKASLMLDEDVVSNQRPYITGHNRVYYHIVTRLPIHPNHIDIDSEEEGDPLWLRRLTIQKFDGLSNVNDGEKELMKLWDLYLMKHDYITDCKLPIVFQTFLDTNGQEIIRKNLYRNFILHMSSLSCYGIVSPETFREVVQTLHDIRSQYAEGQEIMPKNRDEQLTKKIPFKGVASKSASQQDNCALTSTASSSAEKERRARKESSTSKRKL